MSRSQTQPANKCMYARHKQWKLWNFMGTGFQYTVIHFDGNICSINGQWCGFDISIDILNKQMITHDTSICINLESILDKNYGQTTALYVYRDEWIERINPLSPWDICRYLMIWEFDALSIFCEMSLKWMFQNPIESHESKLIHSHAADGLVRSGNTLLTIRMLA